jgi:hypothetical protein
MKRGNVGLLAFALCVVLVPNHSLAADETHRMVVEVFNKSDTDIFVSSEGTSITNGQLDLTKVVAKKGELTIDWQIKLCPPDKTDGSAEVDKQNQRYEIRVSYDDPKNGAVDLTLCRATYRYEEKKKNSTGKKCTLRLYSMDGPDKSVAELNDMNLRGDGGYPLGEHQCVDEQNSAGPHVRSLIFKSTH